MKPIPELNPLFEGVAPSELPEKITSFYEVNDVRKFQFDRPIHKGAVDKENEFKVSCFSAVIVSVTESKRLHLSWVSFILCRAYGWNGQHL